MSWLASGRVALGEEQLPGRRSRGNASTAVPRRTQQKLGKAGRVNVPARDKEADPLASYIDFPLENGRCRQASGRFHHQFMRLAKKRIASTSSASLTVITSSTSWRI